MKKTCYFILGLLFLNLFSCASAPAQKTAAESSVWQISKDGNTVYLGGSVHILPQKTKIPGAFNKAFEAADVLVFEADISELQENPALVQSLQSKMLLPEGQTLKNVLSSESYQKLSDACTLFGFSITQVEQMKPSMVLNVLSVMQLQQNGFTETGVDAYYMEQSEKKHKKMMFLESVDFQIDLTVSMFDDNIDEYIGYSLADLEKDKDTLKTEMEKMLNDWANGTDEYIVQLNTEMQADYPFVYDRLIKDRNNAWVPVIEGYLGSPPVEFIIVGLAHIHGEDGILKQMKEAGYSVNQVR
ncbi:TraB/GumN family protein [Spirochaetia bacterium]|nr:TraB/GumN family protein [Spirochaetia bacterium]